MYLIRFDEIGLKSNTVRKRFIRQLASNISFVLAKQNISAEIIPSWDKIIVRASGIDGVIHTVFGIKRIYVVNSFQFDSLENLVRVAVPIFSDKVRNKSFGVRVSRKGKHNFTSKDVEIKLGNELSKFAKNVDLSNPDVWVKLFIEDNVCYAVINELSGPGGLPSGVEGEALALFSGGIDSPVASWMMLKRGVKLDFVFFKLGDPKPVYDVYVNFCYKWCQYKPKFFVVDFSDVLNKIMNSKPRYRQILLKSVMYHIASTMDYPAFVVGESLGQASTQTLYNLSVLDKFSSKLVLRPLIGMDKYEIVNLAKKIGTYDFSTKVPEMCNISKGSKVATRADYSVVKSLFDELGEISFSVSQYVPPNDVFDVLIDVDKQGMSLDLAKLDKSKSYLVVCNSGLKANIISKMLSDEGFNAVGIARNRLSEYVIKET